MAPERLTDEDDPERRKVGFWLEAEEFDFRLELDAIRLLHLCMPCFDYGQDITR